MLYTLWTNRRKLACAITIPMELENNAPGSVRKPVCQVKINNVQPLLGIFKQLAAIRTMTFWCRASS